MWCGVCLLHLGAELTPALSYSLGEKVVVFKTGVWHIICNWVCLYFKFVQRLVIFDTFHHESTLARAFSWVWTHMHWSVIISSAKCMAMGWNEMIVWPLICSFMSAAMTAL